MAQQRAAGLVAADEIGFRFYVLRRKATGLWELPGGRVDEGERRSDAACREAGEELGVKAVSQGRYARLRFDRRGRAIPYSVYMMTVAKGKPRVAEPKVFDAIEAVCWAELATMPLSDSLRAVLDSTRQPALV